MSKKNFNKTLIVGLGLIGGSFAKAIRQHKISEEIFAFDLDFEAIELAKKQAVIDEFFLLENDLSSFDFIVLATPLSTYEGIFEKLSKKISADAVLIDLGSVKNFRIKNLPKNFIPCHPIAGSEKTGFKHSSADLFQQKKFVICAENQASETVKKIENLAREIGSIPDFIDAKRHDEIYALVSHLPQFLSFLTKEFSPKNLENEFFKTAFRLDNSSPEIWSEIFKFNEKNLEKFYLKFFANLEKFEEKIAAASKQALSHAELAEACLFFSSDSLADSAQAELKANPFCIKTITENFPAIFFRLLVVLSYLQIPEIKTFQNYAGSGFRDFTSITEILNSDPEKLETLLQKNRQKILKLLTSLQ